MQEAMDSNIDPGVILQDGLIAGMNEVGRDFKDGSLFVPEVLVAARAMHSGMDVLRPYLSESDTNATGKFVIGTVEGDLHDIGKNLVKMMLVGAGFEVIDLGVDVKAEAFVAAIKEHSPHIVGMSALLTTTMVNIKSALKVIEDAGSRESVKVMVGGAPMTAVFANDVGANGYAPDAASAVSVAKELVG